MIKKIFIFLAMSIMILSCGKKSDPTYKNTYSNFLNSKSKIVL